ncbi:MAG: class I SAM-dependent methyltransferase, partial [Planctomycetaceae bacterium]
QGIEILCLASGGGQQGPLLAAAGSQVTVFDNSPAQLSQDFNLAQQHGLPLQTIEGDMRDLSRLRDASYDMIFHPCSNCFIPDTTPVWNEAARVLRTGGRMLSGMNNPVRYLFDQVEYESGTMHVRHQIPYSDLNSLTDQQRQRLIYDSGEPLEFGHTLEQLLGGQTTAGLAITGLYEDRYTDIEDDPLSKYCDSFIATRSLKIPQPV